jgi:hypothetical protein
LVRHPLAALLLLAGVGAFTAPSTAAATASIAVDGSSPGLVFGGVGALSAGASSRLYDNMVVTPAPDEAAKLGVHDVTPVYVASPGGSTDISAQVTNPGPVVATDVHLRISGPQGWTATPIATGGISLAPGRTGTWSWHVTPPADAQPGRYSGTLALHYSSGGERADDTRSLPFLLEVIPHDGMTVTSDSFQAHYDDWCCEPHFAIDDNPSTLWHTQFSPYDPLPRSITLDLGMAYDVSGLRYVPRQDNNHNGVITSYAVSVSSDGTNFTQMAAGAWADDFATKAADFAAQPARYVRLTALAGHAGLASAAELEVVGTPGGGA